MSYFIRNGLFVGVDDGPFGDDAMSIMAGSLSATVLHAEFESRCPEGKWELLIPNDTTQVSRAHLLVRLKQFLIGPPQKDPAIIYFAGHGCAFEGKYIFCPQDFTHDLPDATGLTLGLLSALIQRLCLQGRKIVVVFDTCRTLIDRGTEVGEAVPPDCTIIHTCGHGQSVIEIDGYSDFVRRFLEHITEAAGSKSESVSTISVQDMIEDMQTSRAKGGSGRPLRLAIVGRPLNDIYFSMRGEPTLAPQKTIGGQLISRSKPPGTCGRVRGEMLNKITHATGVPMDPNIVQIIKADEQGSEIIRISLPLTRAIKNARVLEYIVREWSYLFTDLHFSIPSKAPAAQLSRVLRANQFDIWSSENCTMALKKNGAVAIKVEILDTTDGGCEVRLTCLGEDEKRGLERLDDLFFPLVRDLIDVGLSA